MKVVFDTNVYISALCFLGGNAEKAYELALHKGIELYTSPAILFELSKKLKEKFYWEDNQIIEALTHISHIAKITKPKKILQTMNDEPDNRILECAVEASIDAIITGDSHLLRFKKYNGIEIIKIIDLLNHLQL